MKMDLPIHAFVWYSLLRTCLYWKKAKQNFLESDTYRVLYIYVARL